MTDATTLASAPDYVDAAVLSADTPATAFAADLTGDPAAAAAIIDTASAVDSNATSESAAIDFNYDALAVPDGLLMEEGVFNDYKQAAKEIGLSPENATKLMEFGALAQAKALDKMSSDWEASSLADKEFGGDKFGENLAIASKARDAFATPELIDLLDATRLGNHPEMIRAFYKIGKALSEDNLVSGGKAPAAQQTAAEKLYGNH